MTTKKKIWLVLGGLCALFALILLLFLLTAGDISDEKLGPSPFNVDESLISDDNLAYKTIVEIGKKIQGDEDFRKNFSLDLYDPQPTIFQLIAHLQNNEGLIEQANLDLFKKIKFPKNKIAAESKIKLDSNCLHIYRLLNLINYRIIFNLLTKDFENAKTDLILSNQISTELLKKTNNIYMGMLTLIHKSNEFRCIELLINHSAMTIEQKLDILNLTPSPVSIQVLKNLTHFEIEYCQKILRDYDSSMIKNYMISNGIPYIPTLIPFFYQPNKSARIYRKRAIEIIDKMEKSTSDAFAYLNAGRFVEIDSSKNYFKYLKPNCLGQLGVESSLELIKTIADRILSTNNKRNLLFVAQQLLLYKTKNGSLPKNLLDLGLDKELYTDIITGDPFLYFEPNGILQSIGRNERNDNLDLTTKILSPDEIHDILCNIGSEFILYLK